MREGGLVYVRADAEKVGKVREDTFVVINCAREFGRRGRRWEWRRAGLVRREERDRDDFLRKKDKMKDALARVHI